MTATKETLSKHINTVLLSFISIMMTISIVVLMNLSERQRNTETALAVLAESVVTHNNAAAGHIETIKSHEKRITILENGRHITYEEAMAAIDDLKDWIDARYQRK